MEKIQVGKMENLGVNRTREGAFSPTPNDLVQKLVNAIKEELELIKNSDRAIESIEFSNRIEGVAVRVLKEHNIDDVNVEYIYDEYPMVATYVRIINQLSWERVKAVDTLIVGPTEITIYYEADVLQFKSKYYIKINEFDVTSSM